MDRKIVLNEMCAYPEYDRSVLEKMSDEELGVKFNEHCVKYSQVVKASEVHKIKGTVAIDTPDGYQLIGDYWIKGGKEIYSVKVDDVITKVSGDHLFQTDEGWVLTRELTSDHSILTKNGFRKVQYVRKHKELETTYDWEVLHENHRYWTNSGLSSHNTGKTFLVLNMCREAQKMGYFVVFYDSENAVDEELVRGFGVNPTLMRYEPVQTVQEFRSNVTSLIDTLLEEKKKGNEIPKLFIVLDSAGNLATQKEIDDAKAYSDKSDMSRAKMMKSVIRIMMSKLGIIGGSFVFTNHVYKSLDLYARDIQSGGCLVPGSKVLMSDGTYKNIEDIECGDMVMTLCGEKEILQTWEFEKPTITAEFEDGSVLTCSQEHRFYIGGGNDDVNDDKNWVYARDLVAGDEIKRSCGDAPLCTLKVKDVKSDDSPTKVNDLTVADVQHYITDNGVVNHNTGIVYGASLILNLSKSKIKDGTTQTGIKVTAKPDKNRFCKPMPVSFHINYERGMNPYIGLEEYMKWELCGVGRGKFLTAKEYAKLSDSDKAKCFQHPMDAELYFQPNENARSICTSHSVEPFALKEWVTPKVWTNERLAQLDEYIKKLFAYSKAGDEETAEEMLAESEGMEDEN